MNFIRRTCGRLYYFSSNEIKKVKKVIQISTSYQILTLSCFSNLCKHTIYYLLKHKWGLLKATSNTLYVKKNLDLSDIVLSKHLHLVFTSFWSTIILWYQEQVGINSSSTFELTTKTHTQKQNIINLELTTLIHLPIR